MTEAIFGVLLWCGILILAFWVPYLARLAWLSATYNFFRTLHNKESDHGEGEKTNITTGSVREGDAGQAGGGVDTANMAVARRD